MVRRSTPDSVKEQALLARVKLIDGALCYSDSLKPIPLQTDRDGYRKFTLRGGDRKVYFAAHRAVWFLHYGEWPKHTIDHINRDRADNRIENLQDITHKENVRRSKRSFQPGRGVRFDRQQNKWRAQIRVNGAFYSLGSFVNEADARDARARAEKHFAGAAPLSASNGRVARIPRARPTSHRKASVC